MPNPLDGLVNAQGLKEHYQKARQPLFSWEDRLPDVAPPSWFQPDPLVVGQPEQARAVKALADLDPLTKSQVRQVTFGPTAGTMRQMTRSGLPIDRFAGTTLLGATDITRERYGDIGINPGEGDYLPVVAHELGHVAGYGEPGAQKAEQFVTSAPDIIDQLVNAFKKAGINATVKVER